MSGDQIEKLRKLDRAPDGSCWYCATVMQGHFDGCPVSLLPRLLDEREALLAALKAAADKLLYAHSNLMHSWAHEQPCEIESANEASHAEEAARAAIAKAEAP